MAAGFQKKASLKQKPQSMLSVDTGTISFAGGTAPAGPLCSLFYTSPKLGGRKNTMGLVLRGV